jgi:hypothetical protein
LILQKTAGDWKPLIYLMIGAALIAALCWLYLDPERARLERERALGLERLQAQADAAGASI